MANFYTDNPDLKHHLTHPMMQKIVALKERDYSDAAKFDYAPFNFDDAMDNYDKVLEIVGDLCGNVIAGMQDSSIIISINNDPDAPINKIADYVIVGDVETVVPKLIKYYKKNSK